jgi:uncharacterized damage-inducible protein DinB
MSMPTPKEQFLNAFKMETATTLKVLKAYPKDKMDLKPASKSKNARDLAWTFAMENGLAEKSLTGTMDWSKPPSAPPPAPESMDAIIGAIDQGNKKIVALVEKLGDEQMLGETVKFFVGPKTLGDIPRIQFLWMLLCDQIHHRGQFSVYLRMADGKLPSIYGPTADEPWM